MANDWHRGRGRGRGRGWGGRRTGTPRPPGGSERAPPGPSSIIPPSGAALELRLLAAGSEFFEKVGDTEVGAELLEKEAGSTEQRLQLAEWRDLNRVLAWFREGAGACKQAELAFSPTLNKDHRAQVHAAADAVGLGGLESVSRGFGDERYVSVVCRGGPAAKQQVRLSRDKKHKAQWLRKWAQQEGVAQLSIDEAEQLVLADALPPALAELWARKAGEQRMVGALLAACSRGDLAALQAAIDAAGAVVRDGVYDAETCRGVLHSAAGGGHVAALELLLAAGAPVDAKDGNGLTALQVSRRWEQCDAEGVLLRAGAHDPDADRPLGPAADAQTREDAADQSSSGMAAHAAAAATESGTEASRSMSSAPTSGLAAGSKAQQPAHPEPCNSFSSTAAQAGSVDGTAADEAGDAAVTACASAHADSDGPHGPGLAEGKAADQHCSKDAVGTHRVADLHPESWSYVQWLGAVCAFSAAAALALYLSRQHSGSARLK